MLYSGFSIDYNVVCSTGGGPDAGCRRGWKAMTEREKMLSGALYWAGAPELVQARRRAKELCSRFNQEAVQDPEAGARLLRELLGEAGDDISIQPMFWCDYGCNIRMGSQIEINHNCVILDCAPVAFGDHVFIGPNCGFYTAGHPLDAAPPERWAGVCPAHHRGGQRLVRRQCGRPARGHHRLRRGHRRGERGQPGRPAQCGGGWQSLPGAAPHPSRRHGGAVTICWTLRREKGGPCLSGGTATGMCIKSARACPAGRTTRRREHREDGGRAAV